MELSIVFDFIQKAGLPVTIIGVLLGLVILTIKKFLAPNSKDTEWKFELKAQSRNNSSKREDDQEA
jgi:hypothetical protein